jgi:hypothetical protein
MNFYQFTNWCKGKIVLHPNLKQEINEFYSLAQSEIADGGSEQHEIDLAMNDINELINQ